MQGVPCKYPAGAVAMITGDTTRYAQSLQALTSLIAPAGSVLAWHMGVLIARSINDAFSVVMDNPKFEWAWVMGDDHTYSPDILMNLLARDKEIVVPLCLNRMPPLDPTIIQHDVKRMKYLEDIPTTGLYKLQENETCGDAGLLIRKSALMKLGPPWYDRKKSGAHAAEDQEFIDKVKEHGFDVYVDMDNPIGHLGIVEFKPIRKGDHWEVRLTGGGHRHIADLGVLSREDRAKIEEQDKHAKERTTSRAA